MGESIHLSKMNRKSKVKCATIYMTRERITCRKSKNEIIMKEGWETNIFKGFLLLAYSSLSSLNKKNPSIRKQLLPHYSFFFYSRSSSNLRMCVNHSIMSDSLRPHGRSLSRLLCPWNSPGKNTRNGLPFLCPRDRPAPGIETGSPTLRADALPSEPLGKGSPNLKNISDIWKFSLFWSYWLGETKYLGTYKWPMWN